MCWASVRINDLLRGRQASSDPTGDAAATVAKDFRQLTVLSQRLKYLERFTVKA
jgi:hypothetical protein